MESELAGGMAGVRAAGGVDCNQLDAGKFFQHGEQRAGRETSGAKKADADRFVAGGSPCRDSNICERAIVGIFRISDQDAETIFISLPGD